MRHIWLDIGQVLFLLFLDRDSLKKSKREGGQYPAILGKQAWSTKDFYLCGIILESSTIA